MRDAAAFGRIPLRWWTVMLGLAALPNIGALLLRAGFAGRPPELAEVSDLVATPVALLSIAGFAVVSGWAEEAGWRGYALGACGTVGPPSPQAL